MQNKYLSIHLFFVYIVGFKFYLISGHHMHRFDLDYLTGKQHLLIGIFILLLEHQDNHILLIFFVFYNVKMFIDTLR